MPYVQSSILNMHPFYISTYIVLMWREHVSQLRTFCFFLYINIKEHSEDEDPVTIFFKSLFGISFSVSYQERDKILKAWHGN